MAINCEGNISQSVIRKALELATRYLSGGVCPANEEQRDSDRCVDMLNCNKCWKEYLIDEAQHE